MPLRPVSAPGVSTGSRTRSCRNVGNSASAAKRFGELVALSRGPDRDSCLAEGWRRCGARIDVEIIYYSVLWTRSVLQLILTAARGTDEPDREERQA